MKYKDFAKKIVSANSYLAEGIYSIFANKYNKEMAKFVDEISAINSIVNVSEFTEKLHDMPNAWHNTFTNYKNSYAENTLYGYANEVMKYAGIDSKEMFYFPLLEHGIMYNNTLALSRYNTHRPYIFQGRSCESQWKQISKKKAYYIGPYIHYASTIYDESELRSLKAKLGKVALVFLPHSVEFDQFSIHIDEIVHRYTERSNENVDTILICAYYNDLSSELIRSLERTENIKLVCAGFKLDPLFVCRLKTILQLSDICFFTSFSTSIGYVYYLDKKIVPDIDTSEKDRFRKAYGEAGIKQLNRFEQCFLNGDEIEQREFVEALWGISELKEPDEIREIFMEAKRNMIHSVGF